MENMPIEIRECADGENLIVELGELQLSLVGGGSADVFCQ